MSRAFKKEDDQAQEPVEPEDPNAGRKGYITQAGYRRLQQEIEQLWTVERPKVTNEVAAAAAQGDRSENAEYIYGKRRLREIDRRIRFLAKRLDALTIATPSPQQAGRVYFGAWVTIQDEDGKQQTWRIVGSDESDVSRGCISVESPIAKALLGKAAGDSVTVRRPKGECELLIQGIRYDEG
jgi:transcription elongation factor GreB